MDSFFDSSNSLYNFVVKEGNGVKGLVDLGLLEVPKMYIQPINERINKLDTKKYEIPPIDLSKLNGPKHEEVVDEIVRAAETIGFFQVVNHCVPLELLKSLKDSAHAFFNMPTEKKVVSRTKKMIYTTSFAHEKGNVLEWKDYIRMTYSSDEDALQYWPSVCKDVALKYLKISSQIIKDILIILIGKLGVEIDDSEIENLIGLKIVNMNYYPSCPNPDLTVGIGRHSDISTITVLLQDEIGGLYVKAEDENDVGNGEWLEILSIPGALVNNVGDALQILSNGKYKSSEHKVMASSTQSRVSIPLFALPIPTKRIGPIQEIVKKDGLALYKEVIWQDYMDNFTRNAHEGKKTLDFAKINSV